jgi:hypothetical protein
MNAFLLIFRSPEGLRHKYGDNFLTSHDLYTAVADNRKLFISDKGYQGRLNTRLNKRQVLD